MKIVVEIVVVSCGGTKEDAVCELCATLLVKGWSKHTDLLRPVPSYVREH